MSPSKNLMETLIILPNQAMTTDIICWNRKENIFFAVSSGVKKNSRLQKNKMDKAYSIQLSTPDILLGIYADTVVVNTEAVIRHLSVHKNFSLIRKVKSIPHHFVEIVIRTLKI